MYSIIWTSQHLTCSHLVMKNLQCSVYLHAMQVQVAALEVMSVHLLDTMPLLMLCHFLLCEYIYKFCHYFNYKKGENNSTKYCIHFLAFNCVITFREFGEFHLASSNG